MSVFDVAKAAGRDYITPEDVSAALDSGADVNVVRLDVLEAIGGPRRGAEDKSLCAFVAWKGRT